MNTSKATVLLVDDDPILLRSLVRVLEGEDHQTVVASTVADARVTARSSPIAVAVLDIELPDGSGIELGTELRSDGLVAELLFYSSTDDPAVVAEAERLGRFVAKDGGTAALVAAVGQVCARMGASAVGS